MGKRVVLFVDDEEKMLKSIKRALVDEPYETLFATSGKQALEILEREEVHVIIADICMPEMRGLELLEITKEEYPHVIRLVLSGFTAIPTLLTAINYGQIWKYISKPLKSNEELKAIIRQALEYYDLHSDREMLMTIIELLAHGNDPEAINWKRIKTLISERKTRRYKWENKFSPAMQT
ncbi:MAG: response regulator [Phycisphaerae bacterium]|nr:response regulator [Phycisphaerae bacterium]